MKRFSPIDCGPVAALGLAVFVTSGAENARLRVVVAGLDAGVADSTGFGQLRAPVVTQPFPGSEAVAKQQVAAVDPGEPSSHPVEFGETDAQAGAWRPQPRASHQRSMGNRLVLR